MKQQILKKNKNIQIVQDLHKNKISISCIIKN